MSQKTQAGSSNAAQINTVHKVFAGNCVAGVLLVCVWGWVCEVKAWVGCLVGVYP